MKSRGSQKVSERNEMGAATHANEVKITEAPVALENEDDVAAKGLIQDHEAFTHSMLKPSDVKDIWSIFKVHKKMFNFMQWYFRPRSSFEPERVDYNALNILAEYQTYNLEFLKNKLDLSDEQCANVLDAFWQLLEFDPDEKSVEREIGNEM